jgi:hypothetical protein
VTASADCADQFRQLLFADARLGSLACQIDLNHYRQLVAPRFCAQTVQAAGERDGIQRMNQIKERNRTARFIRLQMADQMPASAVAPEFTNLLVSFLDAVFPQITNARFDGLA